MYIVYCSFLKYLVGLEISTLKGPAEMMEIYTLVRLKITLLKVLYKGDLIK